MARLSLSSVALRDGIVHGLPVTGRELGWSCSITRCIVYYLSNSDSFGIAHIHTQHVTQCVCVYKYRVMFI